MTNVQYSSMPESIQYMPLPDGRADVWLRKNITETTDIDGNPIYTAEETYLRTTLSKTEVEANFDTFFQEKQKELSAEEALEIIMGVME